MLKQHLALALTLLMFCATATPQANAQSGRVRAQRNAEARAGGLSGVKKIATASDSATQNEDGAVTAQGQATGAKFAARDLNRGRRAALIYSDTAGEHHPNKGDKIAGLALLGYMILCGIIIEKDGF